MAALTTLILYLFLWGCVKLFFSGYFWVCVCACLVSYLTVFLVATSTSRLLGYGYSAWCTGLDWLHRTSVSSHAVILPPKYPECTCRSSGFSFFSKMPSSLHAPLGKISQSTTYIPLAWNKRTLWPFKGFVGISFSRGWPRSRRISL